MASSPDQLRALAPPIERKVKSLLNADLKSICKGEGLLVSGVKAVLQQRVLERLNDAVETGDLSMFNNLRQRINHFGTPLPPPHMPQATSSQHSSSPSDFYRTMPNGYTSRGAIIAGQAGSTARPHFKDSPFYAVHEPLTGAYDLPIITSGRNNIPITFTISPSAVERLRNDKTLRVMLYCAIDPGNSSYPVDITFPSQVEVRVNQDVYQGNLRGIKKKPGTTRPADITDLTRKLSGYNNVVNLTYAATDRVHNPNPSKYCAVVYIVKKHSVEELLERIKRANMISKQSVVDEMVNKAKDPDIVTTSTVMSLKCPLSTMRMTLPCRSTACRHNQCFDAASFLQIQEQAPQWTCPTCNKTCTFSSLAIDLYVQDILNNVAKSVDQVVIEPDGTWKVETDKDDFRMPVGTAKRKTPAEFDDLIELSDHHLNGYHTSTTPQPFATPSREVSRAASSNPRPSSAKKSTEEVIDLTADSDEEDEPPRRPVKRQSTGSFANGTTAPVMSSAYTPNVLPQRTPTSVFSFPMPSHSFNQSNAPYSQGFGNWS